MKKINIIQLIIGLGVVLGLFSCSKDVPTRTFFPHSTPVIESATISPNIFIYGDSVTFVATVSDKETPLSTITMQLIVEDLLITDETLRTPGYETEVSGKFLAQFLPYLNDDVPVEVLLQLINVEGDVTWGNVDGIVAKRPQFDKLYMVLENGSVITLQREGTSYIYSCEGLSLKGGSITYKITDQITADSKIDYSGYVWANNNGLIRVMGDQGTNITTSNSALRKTNKISFDAYSFETTIEGEIIDPNNPILNVDDLVEVTISGVDLYKATLTLTEGHEIILEDGFLGDDVYFEPTFFERVGDDKVKFLGEDGTWNIYCGVEGKNVFVQNTETYEYPKALLVNGEGLGYPSKVVNVATTAWNFDTPLSYIVFKNIGNSKYQATVYMNAEKASFKPFETTGWANEKKSDDFTLPAILANSASSGSTDGNWHAAPGTESGVYTITIDLLSSVVTAEKVEF